MQCEMSISVAVIVGDDISLTMRSVNTIPVGYKSGSVNVSYTSCGLKHRHREEEKVKLNAHRDSREREACLTGNTTWCSMRGSEAENRSATESAAAVSIVGARKKESGIEQLSYTDEGAQILCAPAASHSVFLPSESKVV